ncbi:hypothetical protein WA158_001347 [Blastocystis sp. Blastoise]
MSDTTTGKNTFSTKTDAKPFIPSGQRQNNLAKNAPSFFPIYRQQNENDAVPTDYLNATPFYPSTTSLQSSYRYDDSADNYDQDGQDAYYYYQDNPLNIPFTFPPPSKKTVRSCFIPSSIQKYYEMETAAIINQEPPSDPRYKQIPPRYNSLKELSSAESDNITGSFGYLSSSYKVIDSQDGNPYMIRRFERVRTSGELVNSVLQTWKNISHPNIVSLTDCYIYNGALLFVHDYYPNAMSIRQKYMVENASKLTEDLLWCILIQLLSAIYLIHTQHLACRCINEMYILETGRNRFRIGSCGINDILDPKTNINEEQSRDMFQLAQMILTLGCIGNNQVNMKIFSSNYGSELVGIISQMWNNKPISCYQALNMATPQVIRALNSTFSASDFLSNCLGREINNSIYLRMLIKLGYINERPSFASNPRWSETGDRYLLKLFRDYLFHQEDDQGVANMDIGHIFDTLSKLEIGSEESIALHSRDGKNLLVCTYADIKRSLDSTFEELRSNSNFSDLRLSSSNRIPKRTMINQTISNTIPISIQSSIPTSLSPNPMVSPVSGVVASIPRYTDIPYQQNTMAYASQDHWANY